MKKDNYTVKDIIKLDIRISVLKAIKVYGLEGTEQKINELYLLMPKIKELMLQEYNNILKGE
jgi:hypothetical protein